MNSWRTSLPTPALDAQLGQGLADGKLARYWKPPLCQAALLRLIFAIKHPEEGLWLPPGIAHPKPEAEIS